MPSKEINIDSKELDRQFISENKREQAPAIEGGREKSVLEFQESARETLAIMDLEVRRFQGASVELAAETSTNSGLSMEEQQQVREGMGLASKLAELDEKAVALAGSLSNEVAQTVNSTIKEQAEYEEFSPKAELAALRKLPKDQQKGALAEFKHNLNEQKLALAELHTALEEAIRKNPDVPFAELWKMVREAYERHHFDGRQTDTIAEILHSYKEKHESVKKASEQFAGNPEGLYEYALGRKPKGKVEVIVGPMSIYFKCRNFDDYAAAWGDDQKSRKKAKDSAGVRKHDSAQKDLAGTLTLEKDTWAAKLLYPGSSRSTFIHEEQHVIHSLFTEEKIKSETLAKSFPKAKSWEEKVKLFSSNIRTVRWNHLDDTKDEMLAYMKAGTGKQETFSNLVNSDLYKHMEPLIGAFTNWVKENGQEIEREASQQIKEVFVKEYRQFIKDGFDALKVLESQGMSKQKALALLEHEPLQRWLKVASRIKVTSKIEW